MNDSLRSSDLVGVTLEGGSPSRTKRRKGWPRALRRLGEYRSQDARPEVNAKRLVVTGESGFFGRHLLEAPEDHRSFGVARRPQALCDAPAHRHKTWYRVADRDRLETYERFELTESGRPVFREPWSEGRISLVRRGFRKRRARSRR